MFRMTLIWTLLVLFGLTLLARGTTAGKGSHIIQSFLEAMRDRNGALGRMNVHDDIEGDPEIGYPRSSGLYTLPFSKETTAEVLRKMAEKYPDMTSELVMEILNKRHVPIMYGMDFAGFDKNGLQRYIIKKVKRRPEDFPSDMYTVQGGKQQLEVDLDNQLMAQERQMEAMGEKIEENENDLIDNEDDINESGQKLDDVAPNEEVDLKDAMAPFPSDIIIGGADLSLTGNNEEVRNVEQAKRSEMSRKRRLDFAKRFWAANSLYKLRIPKSKSGRSFRTRTALPRFDPILYFIGLGK